MRANRRRDTGPEMVLRRELHRQGLRFRVDYAPIAGVPCRADIVFPRARVAVFVDGCFWHACPEHGNLPRANEEWWRAKLDVNVARDRRTDETLSAKGWHVIRIWEHETLDTAVERVITAVDQPGGAGSAGDYRSSSGMQTLRAISRNRDARRPASGPLRSRSKRT